ncbi:trigger factor [Leptothermofonsia sp. ETS-13]|uniref:trigger factor n=1 Tax=Leptothermofonsia sp. ETS-13 TaxID=3035696 RepID=UPI003B9F589F
MKVTQEKLPASQIGLEIEITPEMTKQAYEQVIQKFTRSANIPGFRKGKVPRQVLVQRLGSLQLKAAALEELIDDSFKQALEQEKIDALGNFQLRSSFEELVTQYEPGSPLTFSASVDVQPEVKLNQYRDLTVQAEEIKPDPERVDRVLQQYREQTATLVPVEGRPAQLKDVTVVDFKGVLVSDEPDAEPEEFPGGQADDFQVELDEEKFIPGFVNGIVGMSVGETKEVPVEFPEDYAQPNLTGRRAVFTITLKELKEKELPDLDDDFAQEVSEYETLAELRESLEKRYQEEADNKTAANKEQAILNELIKHLEVDLPETLVDRELNFMINQTAVQLQKQGLDIRQFFNQDTIPMLKERSRPEAINRIKRTLALGEVAKREAIEVEPEAVTRRVEEILEELGEESLDIDRDRLQEVVSEDLLREKIVNWLIEHSTIELVPEGTLAKAEETESEATDLEVTAPPEEAVDVSAETLESAKLEEPTAAPVDAVPVDAAPAKPKKTSKKTSKTAEDVSASEEESTLKKEPDSKEEAPAKRKSSKAKSKTSDGE